MISFDQLIFRLHKQIYFNSNGAAAVIRHSAIWISFVCGRGCVLCVYVCCLSVPRELPIAVRVLFVCFRLKDRWSCWSSRQHDRDEDQYRQLVLILHTTTAKSLPAVITIGFQPSDRFGRRQTPATSTTWSSNVQLTDWCLFVPLYRPPCLQLTSSRLFPAVKRPSIRCPFILVQGHLLPSSIRCQPRTFFRYISFSPLTNPFFHSHVMATHFFVVPLYRGCSGFITFQPIFVPLSQSFLPIGFAKRSIDWSNDFICMNFSNRILWMCVCVFFPKPTPFRVDKIKEKKKRLWFQCQESSIRMERGRPSEQIIPFNFINCFSRFSPPTRSFPSRWLKHSLASMCTPLRLRPKIWVVMTCWTGWTNVFSPTTKRLKNFVTVPPTPSSWTCSSPAPSCSRRSNSAPNWNMNTFKTSSLCRELTRRSAVTRSVSAISVPMMFHTHLIDFFPIARKFRSTVWWKLVSRTILNSFNGSKSSSTPTTTDIRTMRSMLVVEFLLDQPDLVVQTLTQTRDSHIRTRPPLLHRDPPPLSNPSPKHPSSGQLRNQPFPVLASPLPAMATVYRTKITPVWKSWKPK